MVSPWSILESPLGLTSSLSFSSSESIGESDVTYSGSLGSSSLLDPISSSLSEVESRSGENLPLALVQSGLIFLGETRGWGMAGDGERGGLSLALG